MSFGAVAASYLAVAGPTPLSAWGFSEASGSTAQSQHGGYVLTANNPGTAWGTSKAGNGACAVGEFTGMLGTVLPSWTIQFDLFINSFDGWSSIVEITSEEFYVEHDGNGVFDVFLGGEDGNALLASPLSTGIWYNIAVTHDHGLEQTLIYLDTVLAATKNHTATTGTLNLGMPAEVCGSSGAPLDGKVDNLRLFDHVLTQSEIVQLAGTPVS